MSPYVIATMLVAAMVFTGVTPAPECPVNQIWNPCGAMCEPTCSNRNPNPKFCPRIRCTQYTAGCRCQTSYYKKDDGSCVPLEDC
ncbi:chymotrypsin inhibitor-like [Hylaeus volcanicus]|uniref:chymotrypsin inhibitor-like n=1 Tax=Hylaeus volcanicus TaxID=313075 RepID=UPI0023B7C203|nr:chymotrypsin inhibitor-like [Hylaeus volcanicus]